MQYLFMCRSLTAAQRAAAVLNRSGISAFVIKVPQRLSEGGCGYAVSVRRRLEEADDILRRYKMPFGKVYEKDGEVYREVWL